MVLRGSLEKIIGWPSAVAEIADSLSQTVQMTLSYVIESQLVRFKNAQDPIKDFRWVIRAEGRRESGVPGNKFHSSIWNPLTSSDFPTKLKFGPKASEG